MTKRRKNKNRDGWQSFDNFDDFLDAIEKNARKKTEGDEGDDGGSLEPEVEKISLRDFVVEQKISAFVHGYAPCNEGDTGYEQFDDARLREVFKAYVCSLGDPLKLYLDDLSMAGFQMTCSMLTGEPCIFARRRG